VFFIQIELFYLYAGFHFFARESHSPSSPFSEGASCHPTTEILARITKWALTHRSSDCLFPEITIRHYKGPS